MDADEFNEPVTLAYKLTSSRKIWYTPTNDNGEEDQNGEWLRVSYHNPDRSQAQLRLNYMQRRRSEYRRNRQWEKWLSALETPHYDPYGIVFADGHQDWAPVRVDRRPRNEDGEIIAKRPVELRRKRQHNLNRGQDSRHERAIERHAETGDTHIRMFDSEFIKQVISTRVDRMQSQEELARQLNRQHTEIARFERGELPYDPSLKTALSLWGENTPRPT